MRLQNLSKTSPCCSGKMYGDDHFLSLRVPDNAASRRMPPELSPYDVHSEPQVVGNSVQYFISTPSH